MRLIKTHQKGRHSKFFSPGKNIELACAKNYFLPDRKTEGIYIRNPLLFHPSSAVRFLSAAAHEKKIQSLLLPKKRESSRSHEDQKRGGGRAQIARGGREEEEEAASDLFKIVITATEGGGLG